MNTDACSLPQELLDQIIDHFQGDKQSLSKCSLVSQRWVARSHRHLFRTLTVIAPTVSSNISTLHHYDVTEFLTFLRNTPGVRHYLHDLTIRPRRDRLLLQQTGISITQIFQIRYLAPNLSHLSLLQVTLLPQTDYMGGQLFSLPSPSSSRLSRLTLEDVNGDLDIDLLFSPVIDLIEFFGSIDTLCIDGWIPQRVPSYLAKGPAKVRISSVIIRRADHLESLGRILAAAAVDVAAITRIKFVILSLRSFEAYNSFFKALNAQSIHEIEVGLDGLPIDAFFMAQPHLMLSSSTSIRSIALRIRIYAYVASSSESCQWAFACRMLSTASLQTLSKVTIHFEVVYAEWMKNITLTLEDSPDELTYWERDKGQKPHLKRNVVSTLTQHVLGGLEWEDLQVTLDRIPNLQELVFHLNMHGYNADEFIIPTIGLCRTAIANALPKYFDRGLIRVEGKADD